MRGNISKLETVGRETLDLEESRAILDMVEKHREQLTACQRQFRLANVKAMTALETQSSRDLFKSSGGDNPGLRQRRDKEQMVTEYSNVTDNLTAISRQLAETVESSRLAVSNLEGTSKTVDELG